MTDTDTDTEEPTRFKIERDPAEWARAIVGSPKRQWGQAELLLEALEDLVAAAREPEGWDEMDDTIETLRRIGREIEATSAVGLVATADQAGGFGLLVEAIGEAWAEMSTDVAGIVEHWDAAQEALDDRASADQEVGEERRDGLAEAWDELVASLDLLADALDEATPARDVDEAEDIIE